MGREFVLNIEMWKIQETRQNIWEGSAARSVGFIRDVMELVNTVFKNSQGKYCERSY